MTCYTKYILLKYVYVTSIDVAITVLVPTKTYSSVYINQLSKQIPIRV